MDPTADPVRLSGMRRIVTVSAAALAVLAAGLVVVLTQRSPVLQSKVVPMHAKLLPARPPAASRPAIIPGGPARNLEPAQPIPSGGHWGFR
jgi:hypothetical protein